MHLSKDAVSSLGDISVVLGGDLSIRKSPHEPVQIAGTLQTIRGSYAYQGRRFTIERDGTLRFLGGASLDPLLGITATRTVSGVLIRAAIRGQASAPELELTSVPTLDESDILSLLLFNQPVNELATVQRNALALQAATLASGFVVSPAVSAVGEKLGLDFLQLEADRHRRIDQFSDDCRTRDLERIVFDLRARVLVRPVQRTAGRIRTVAVFAGAGERQRCERIPRTQLAVPARRAVWGRSDLLF